MKNIIVLATATNKSGALTIYQQFISHLSAYLTSDLKYYIFIDPKMPSPDLENVNYVHEENHSWKRRIWFNRKGVTEWAKKNNIKIDLVISLQNTGAKGNFPQIIYYHQSIPFSNYKWNPFKSSKERLLFLYKYIYPFFVKETLNEETDVAVQLPYVKRSFSKKFGFALERIHVMLPDPINIIDEIHGNIFQNDKYNFVYPAVPENYKEHKTIVEALCVLSKNASSFYKRIKVYFTFGEDDFPELIKLIKSYGLVDNFVFIGQLPHTELLSYIKSSNALLFPSVIETLGLPLLEAAAMGVPIVATDMNYAKEALFGYEGADFAKWNDYNSWAHKIERLCMNPTKKYDPYLRKGDWDKFFELINHKLAYKDNQR